VHRGFAQERPEDSSSSNWGVGEPPIDEKHTERGTAPGSEHSQQPQGNSSSSPELSTDAEGQKYTPNLSKQKSTRDFINTQREERLHGSEVGTFSICQASSQSQKGQLVLLDCL